MSSKVRKIIKPAIWTVAGFVSIILVALTAIQIVCSGEVMMSLINKYYPLLIDGKLEMSSPSFSMFRHFPAAYLEVNDLSITYPADRFDSLENSGCRNFLIQAGNYRPTSDSSEEPADTLASFSKFKLAVNLFSLVRGTINIKEVELLHPRMFIHVYNDGSSNLDIFKLTDSEEEVEDSVSFDLSSLIVRRLLLDEKPYVVFTSQKDTLFNLGRIKRCSIDGWQNIGQLDRGRCKLRIDSLFVAGHNKSDTLVFSIDSLYLNKYQSDISLQVGAKAFAATHTLGRVKIPLRIDGEVKLENPCAGQLNIGLHPLTVDVTTARADMDMDLEIADNISMKGTVKLPGINIQKFIDEYGSHIIPELSKINTDACLTAKADIDGFYSPKTGELPGFSASISLPRCTFIDRDYPKAAISMKFNVNAAASQGEPATLEMPCFNLSSPGLKINAEGSVEDLIGDDPFFSAKAHLTAGLDTLDAIIGSQIGFDSKGKLKLDAEGQFKLSNLNLFNLKGASLRASMLAENVDVKGFNDSLRIFCDSLSVKAGLVKSRLKKSSNVQRIVLGASVNADSIFFLSEGAAQIKGKNISIFAQTSPESVKINDSTSYNPILAKLEMGSVFMEGVDSLSIRVKNSSNRLAMRPSRQNASVPSVKLVSQNDRIRIKCGPHRFFFRDLSLTTKAELTGELKAKARKAFMDSVYRSYPDLSKDSVNAIIRQKYRKRMREMQLSEDDFKEKDLQINLSSTASKYFHDWDFEGNLKLNKFLVLSPAFPLKTYASNFSCTINNDMLSLDSLRLKSGDSDMKAEGRVSNIRKTIRRRGNLKVDVSVRTDSLALSQLLNAYAQGVKNMKEISQLAKIDDDNILADSIFQNKDNVAPVLVVIPRNVDANIELRGKGMTYSDINVERFDADLKMKNHCLQLTDLSADSSVGKVKAEAFYSTKSKSDIYAGLDLSLNEISAEGVIDVIPQIDTLIPLLKSFGGLLNCNVSATTKLDTSMNIQTNTIDGVFRFAGKDLHFQDNESIKKIGKKMFFKNPGRATIDTMTVEGTIKDGRLEIFPFLLQIDRWSVALAGITNVDKSFNYHISFLKTPFVFKFGANIYGDDFDNVKFKLGKARYTDKKIPSFSTEIDNTRINLLSSIRNIFDKGVKRAVEENKAQESLNQARRTQDYNHSVALDSLDALSKKDRFKLDSLKLSAVAAQPGQ